jgi:sulfur carrier protein
MTVTLNGLPTSLDPGTTVAGLVSGRSLPRTGVAVAVNGTVVRAADWDRIPLADGDAVEIVTARQGG